MAETLPDSAAAWQRLFFALIAATVGGVGLWSSVVVLPYVEADFGIDRGQASIPYMATMIGFALGGVLMGRLADRFGVGLPVVLGGVFLCIGYIAASLATGFWQFVAVQGIAIGLLGASPFFGPLVADISHFFRRRRGLAVAVAASGNYLAGAVWPPILTEGIAIMGWRDTYFWVGIACAAIIIPMALAMRVRPDFSSEPAPAGRGHRAQQPGRLLLILCFAGVACCVAMSMPQVHLVAYCADLGFGAAAGAEMLSIMLVMGVVSRIISGLIADRIGGLGTLVLGSLLQTLALAAFLPFEGMVSLYVVSALFGLSQGGIVPSYTLIVREYFPAGEAGWRVSLVLMCTILGMALGGWLSGEIYDWTGSYAVAFLNGIAWNLVHLGIAVWLLMGRGGRRANAVPA